VPSLRMGEVWMMFTINHAEGCDHHGLRNEIETNPTDVRFSGRPRPWGGFYFTVTCPDCDEELRGKAQVTELWPAGWRVLRGVPTPPDES